MAYEATKRPESSRSLTVRRDIGSYSTVIQMVVRELSFSHKTREAADVGLGEEAGEVVAVASNDDRCSSFRLRDVLGAHSI